MCLEVWFFVIYQGGRHKQKQAWFLISNEFDWTKEIRNFIHANMKTRITSFFFVCEVVYHKYPYRNMIFEIILVQIE